MVVADRDRVREAGLSDAEIIAASVEDPEMFRVIFSRHVDVVRRSVARRVGIDDADDVTAEIFVRAFRLRARYDLAQPLARPWLFGIATNVVGDHIRRSRRRERTYLAALGLADREADDGDRVAARVDAAGTRAELNRALARLRPGDRDAFLLFALDELPYAEVAVALGIPVGTVRSRISRARSTLRMLVGHLVEDR